MSKLINLSSYQNQKSKEDELIELDFNSFMENLTSGKCKNVKELLKTCRNEN